MELEKVLPSEAMMIQAMAAIWAPPRCSFRNKNPDSAAKAGSRLIKIPNVLAGSAFRATISSEYGRALDKIATAKATGQCSNSTKTEPEVKIPNGSETTAATAIPVDAAMPDGKLWLSFWPKIIYIAQQAPAARAYATPSGFKADEPELMGSTK